MGGDVAVYSLILALIGSWVAVYKYINATADKLDVKIEGTRREALLYADKKVEEESKRRHDDNNRLTPMFARMEKVDDDLRRAIDQLEREVVRKDDIRALEARLLAAFEKAERDRTESFRELRGQMETAVRQINNFIMGRGGAVPKGEG